MTLSNYLVDEGGLDPIDIVESIATFREWDFDRIDDDQIAMMVEGQWRNYSLTLNWNASDETLRSICTFEMTPASDVTGAIYEVVNRANDHCWSGHFAWWPEENLMIYKYGLLLTGVDSVTSGQMDRLISGAVKNCERFYPAFQLVSWAGKTPQDAMKVAIAEAYGRA